MSGIIEAYEMNTINTFETHSDEIIALQQEVEATRHERDMLYHALFEKNYAVKLLIDPVTGQIVDANQAASEFYGYALETLRRMHITEINILPEAQVQIEMQRARMEHRRFFHFRHRLASGDVRDVEVYSGPVQLQGRNLLFSIIHDITPRKQAEEALYRSYKNLEERIQQRTAALSDINEELQAEMVERGRIEAALWASEERYRIISELTSDYTYAFRVEPDGSFVREWVTDAHNRVTGFSQDELDAQGGWRILIHPDDLPIAQERAKRLLAGYSEVREFRIITRYGETRWLRDYARPVWDQAEGRVVRLYGAAQDITERKQAEEELERLRNHHRLILQAAGEGILGLDASGCITFANPAALRMIGYTEGELLGKPMHTLIHHTQADGQHYSCDQCPICATLRDGQTRRAANETFWHKQGTSFAVEYISAPIIDSTLQGTVVIFRDVTARKAIEEQLRYHALYNSLTELPNRTLFLEALEEVMEHTRHDAGEGFAVLIIDLDNFKIINDSLGHLVGDQLLVAVARRLEACLKPGQIVAHLSGDEFAILLDDISSAEEAVGLAECVHEVLVLPFQLSDYEVTISASVGIAMSSRTYEQPIDLLRDADAALHQAKARGRKCHVIFDQVMRVNALERLYNEAALRHAIEHGELCLYYQPIVALDTGRIAGFEALVRWQHPERGIVSPTEFIAMAEETDLIILLDRWVLRAACQQLHTWHQQFPHYRPLTMNVNLSVKSLMHREVVEYTRQVLNETGLDPASLKLEITENVMMDHTEMSIATLKNLSSLGPHLCIDDFGTGYSSLRYLHRFPIQTLKIDRAFISNLHTDAESTAITQSIVTLSHALNKDIVAEGIETTAQLTMLQNLRCEYGQGYLFSRPVERARAAAWLAAEALDMHAILHPDRKLPIKR